MYSTIRLPKMTVMMIMMTTCLHFNPIRSQAQNTLSLKEKKEGWKLLFNGKNLKGWHSYLEHAPGKSWQVKNEAIVLNKNGKSLPRDYADLVTDGEFDNFDLKMEWKMEPCSNSGLMFYVHESPKYSQTYETGPEMQIVDLACSPDSRILMHRAGSLYDLITVDTEWVTVGGKWNQYEVRSDHGHLQLFQNGHLVVDTHLWNAHWRELIAHSKFATMPNFGTFHRGHISLQGTENGKLWFRNIMIRPL
ncbi:MAG: 3-keto-disaccharide hydrolase [Chitinophagaceae bacterium]